MKTISRYAVAIASAVLLLYAPLMMAKPPGDETLSKKELHSLIRTAKTAQDHQKLAEYYRQQAEFFTEERADHVQMAKDYADNPMTHRPSKFPDPSRHCRELVSYYAEQAKHATALAEYHDGMASEVAKEGSPKTQPK
jgi:hypothetical protein